MWNLDLKNKNKGSRRHRRHDYLGRRREKRKGKWGINMVKVHYIHA
jgi:hypothetical protein